MADREPTSKEIATKTRLDTAVALKLSGAPWTIIAEHCGFNGPNAAAAAVYKHIGSTVTEDDRDRLRDLSLARLDQLQRGLWSKAIDPKNRQQLDAVDRVLKIEDRRARLMGLDAPTKVQQISPALDEIKDIVAKIKGVDPNNIGTLEADFDDIEDAEVIEDGDATQS